MTADIHGLSGAYAVDALSDEERAGFEQHLAQCAECRAEVAGLRAAAGELSLTSQSAPPPALRAAVLRQIATVRPLPPELPTHGAPTDQTSHRTGSRTEVQASGREPRHEPSHEPSHEPRHELGHPASGSDRPGPEAPSPGPSQARVLPLERRPRGSGHHPRAWSAWLVAAVAATVLAIGGLVWSPWDNDAPQLTATERVIRAEDAQRYEKTIDGARATIVRSPSLGKAVIIADNMPAAPADKDFQVWLQTPDGQMVSAGLMPHEARPTVSMPLEGDAATAVGAGITMEPAGGSPQPTGEPLVLFEFS